MKSFFHISFRAMGCELIVQLETDHDGHALLNALPAQVEAVEAQLSRFRPASELMCLNAQAGTWVKVSDVLFENIQTAKQAARMTEGHFNPLVLPALVANGYGRSFSEIGQPVSSSPIPAADWHGIGLRVKTREVYIPPQSALDLGGIAKGWMAARIADDLKVYGACLVNFGGDLVACGAPEDLAGWEVSIRDPFNQIPLYTLWLRDASLVTSGIDFRRWITANGEQHHHIVDPKTGKSVNTDVLTVTIYHPHAPTAEAYAKAVMLRGAANGLSWLQTQWNAAGMVVRHDGSILATTHFNNLIAERN